MMQNIIVMQLIVNIVAGLDKEKGIYKTPANTSSLGTFLKKN